MPLGIDTVFIFCLSVSIVVCNVLILSVLFGTEQLSHRNKYFLASLSVADLSVGLLVTPPSVLASVTDCWPLGGSSCLASASISTVLWVASLYSQAWLTVDGYVGVIRQRRTLTATRAACWLAVVWLGAASFCLPTLAADASYDKSAVLCVVNLRRQGAYFVTAGLLVVAPPIVAASVANVCMLTWKYRQKYATDACLTEASLDYTNFVVCVVYFVSWAPWCTLQMYESLHSQPPPRLGAAVADVESPTLAPPTLRFCLMWIAIGNSLYKFIVYIVMDHDFRIGLKILYNKVVCSSWNTAS